MDFGTDDPLNVRAHVNRMRQKASNGLSATKFQETVTAAGSKIAVSAEKCSFQRLIEKSG